MATPGQIAKDDNGVEHIYLADGKWHPVAAGSSGGWSPKRDVSFGDLAKRVATHDIPEAFLRTGDLALNAAKTAISAPFIAMNRATETYAENQARLAREAEIGSGLAQRVLPEAPATDIAESDLSTGQRLLRDTAVGTATAAPVLLSGGSAAPVLLGGAGGGLGSGIAREAGAGPVGQFATGLVTGGLAASAPAAASAVRGGLGKFTAAGRAAAAESAAIRTLANRTQDRVSALGGLELPPKPPGMAPTLSGATDDVGLATLEAEMARQPTAQVGNAPGFAARLEGVREGALDDAGKKLSTFSSGTDADVAAAQSTLRADVDQAASKLRATGVGSNPNVRSEDLYTALRTSSEEVYAPIKARLNRYGEELDAAGVQFQPSRTREALGKIKENAVFREMMALQQEGEGRILTLMDNVIHRKSPAQTSPIVGPTGKPIVSEAADVPMSFREQDALRGYITELRASKSRALRNEAENLHKALEADLRDAVGGSSAGPAHARYREALDDFASASTIYRRDVLEDVTNSRGSFKPETVLGRMWLSNTSKAGAGASAKQLRTALGPRTNVGVDAIVADAFYKSADAVSGVVKPNELAKYMRNHSQALKEFPEARDVLSQAMKTQRAAERLGITKNGSAIERGSFAQFVDEPDAAIAEVMKLRGNQRNQAIAKYQARLKGNPSAEKGFQRLVWEKLSAEATDSSTGNVLWAPGKLRVTIDENESTIRQLWGAEAPRLLKRLADEYERAASIPSPGAVSSVSAPEASEGIAHSGARLLANRINGLPLQTVRASELIHGFMGKKTAIEAQRILEEAFLDPYGRGRALLLKVTPENEKRILEAMRLPAAGVAAGSVSRAGDRE